MALRREVADVVVEAPLEDAFAFTDWCYNNPEWLTFIKKSWITKLPGPDGMGQSTHYVGDMMGERLEWDALPVAYEPGRSFVMRATTGEPAKLRMQAEAQFERLGPRRTRFRLAIAYKVPYPVVGWVMDRLMVRKEVREMVAMGVQGLQRAAAEGRIPPLGDQLAKRQRDHPGYQPPASFSAPSPSPARR